MLTGSPPIWIVAFMAICLSPWFCQLISAEYYAQCEGNDNRYIASPDSCSRYIFCYGQESFEGDCDEEAPYFSEIDQTCDVSEDVCKKFEGTDNGEGDEGDGEGEGTGEGEGNGKGEGGEVVNPGNPEIEPSNPEIPPNVVTSAPAPSPSVSSVSSSAIVTTTVKPSSIKPTQSSAVPTSSTTPKLPSIASSTTQASITAVKCPAEDDPLNLVFLQHPKSCSDYFMCYHGEPIAMHCSHSLHFDVRTRKCDYPENVKCQVVSPREQCQDHTVDVFPHPTNCNYYYLCRLGYLMVMQCPPNMDWDYNRNVCVLRGQATCYSSTKQSNSWNFFLN
ncbi:chondroitin proteoglycan-2-like [Musca vetustissima]|uniref:chondroitin proteoglycan-2-like n=1 Tax=Musca vetustissima TaxID=27455 RepID=UPI002AB782A0|nr:chondroitin proteoglycan-2-like [Musca vetustissima]